MMDGVSCPKSDRGSCKVLTLPPMATSNTGVWWCLALLALSTFLTCGGQSRGNAPTDAGSLDAVIRNFAFGRTIHRTGLAYQVPLPANFSGMEASAMRLRIGSLWTRGANIGEFRVPPGTLAVPFERRVVLVYQNLGNWSTSFFRFPAGYLAVTPVLGLLAYGAPVNKTSVSGGEIKLDLRVTGTPISVQFAGVPLSEGTASVAKCATFVPDGTVHLSEVRASKICTITSPGHLAVVAPAPAFSPRNSAEATGRKRTAWSVWLVACGAVAVGLLLASFAGGGIFLLIKNKRMEKMDGQAEVGVVLKTTWVRSSKMPSATVERTRPVLENGNKAMGGDCFCRAVLVAGPAR